MDFAERVDAAVAESIAANRVAGAVTVVARDGEIVYRKADGWFDREAGTPMFPEAIFRLASVTKPLVAATALAMVERGLLGLDNAVADHLPWFRPKLGNGSEPKITIRHLLTHTSGLSYDFLGDPDITGGLSHTNFSLEENFSRYAQRIPLLFEPGTGWAYGVSIDVLGAVIAQLHGSTLHDAFVEYIAEPLNMGDTGFLVSDPDRLAPPYAGDPPGLRKMGEPEMVVNPNGGVDVFSPDRIFNPRAFQSWGAGAVGTADDLLAFFEAIRNRGTPILKPEIVAQAIQNQIGDLPREEKDAGQRFGFFGAVIVDPVAADRPQAAGTIRWGGIYGHDWFVDFANGITAIMMTNTSPDGCSGLHPRNVTRAIYGV
jgi:CubicO group peptidase (beta-lactamase class C family)